MVARTRTPCDDRGVQHFKGMDRAVRHFEAGDVQDIQIPQVGLTNQYEHITECACYCKISSVPVYICTSVPVLPLFKD